MGLRTLATMVGLLAAFALVTAVPADATPPCDPDSLESTCDVLEDCYVVGALQMTADPAEAVSFYRTCLFTDRQFALSLIGAGFGARERSRPLSPIYVSTFWPLYCEALRRAGQRDPSICERHASSASTTRKHVRKHHVRRRTAARHRTAPRFTG